MFRDRDIRAILAADAEILTLNALQAAKESCKEHLGRVPATHSMEFARAARWELAKQLPIGMIFER